MPPRVSARGAESETNMKVCYEIRGGSSLRGELRVEGAKNAALPMLMAACLGDAPTTLRNVPVHLTDIRAMIDLLIQMGAEVQREGEVVRCSRGTFPAQEMAPEVARQIRSSLLLLGGVAALGGAIRFGEPGGCRIGSRKFDLHLLGLSRLGAKLAETSEEIVLTSDGSLHGSDIEFHTPSTTGTENVMIAACFAEGQTRILNANTRPEVQALGELLVQMGARVSTRNRVVTVGGTRGLRGGADFRVPAAWDEVVTFMVATAMTSGELMVPDFDLRFIREDVRTLREAGVEIFEWGGAVFVARRRMLKPFDVFTGPYPAVNSDMQPIFAALALCCEGESTLTDMRFPERFAYAQELAKLGARLDVYGNSAVVQGGTEIRGGHVRATDLRGGASLVLAGLVSTGTTVVDAVEHIERGYHDLCGKLRALGGSAERRESDE